MKKTCKGWFISGLFIRKMGFSVIRRKLRNYLATLALNYFISRYCILPNMIQKNMHIIHRLTFGPSMDTVDRYL